MLPSFVDVVIVGAGPSGAIASSLLKRKGHNVIVFEKAQFPRFSIGESLLPQSMAFLEEAGLLDAVQSAGFQFKNGAAFVHNGEHGWFDFEDKFTPGWGTTFQVERARFDKLLADGAADQGVDIRYGYDVVAMRPGAQPEVDVMTPDGVLHTVQASFVLDASGFGRVLPRLLELETPSTFPSRTSVFTHIEDNISDPEFDRNKILITVHPEYSDVWFWLIPLAANKCSFGVVAKEETLQQYPGDGRELLLALRDSVPPLNTLLERAEMLFEPRRITGYSCNVRSLHGEGYALLGNAGEFLDPVFSSGVTIAVKSASLAANLLDRQLRGETVDWEQGYAQPLMRGVDTFRAYVEAWYDGRLQDIIFAKEHNGGIKRMICSVLAGYAWDTENPYAQDSARKLSVLAQLCRSM